MKQPKEFGERIEDFANWLVNILAAFVTTAFIVFCLCALWPGH